MNQILEMFIRASMPVVSIVIESNNERFTHSYVKLSNGYTCSLVFWKAPKYHNDYSVGLISKGDNITFEGDVAKDLSDADVLKYLKQISELPNG